MQSTSAHKTFITRKAESLALFQQVMNRVYGEWKANGNEWKPKAYADNKSRYLWTDAFGVCNYITLARETGLAHYLDQADALIKDVHETLGRDRKGNRLPNATDDEPLKGGLRIGKVHDEDHPDGDGQYFHYLTKWAFALNCMSLVRNDKKYNELAVQLLKAVHPRFVFLMNSMRPRMCWKMSIDLQRPLVPSEGNLDPMDGYVTYRLVQQVAGVEVLKQEIAEIYRIVELKWQRYNSEDPLDLGEALWLTHWFHTEDWAAHVARRSMKSLEYLFSVGLFALPHSRRLLFREMGTALGLRVHPLAQTDEWQRRVDGLLAEWEKEVYKRDEDISPVMYCAALLPGAWKRDEVLKG